MIEQVTPVASPLQNVGTPMPFTYEVKEDGALLLVTVTGVVTLQDALSHNEELRTDARIKPGYQHLVDGSRVTQLKITPGDFIDLARLYKTSPLHRMRSQLAIVTTQPTFYLLVKGYELIMTAADMNVVVFSSRRMAELWLGLSPSDALPNEALVLVPAKDEPQ